MIDKIRSLNVLQTLFLGALYTLALALPIAEALKQFSIIIIILLGIHLIFKKELKLEENILIYSATGFVILSLFSAFLAINSSVALKGCIDIFKIIMIFLIIQNISLKQWQVILFTKILFLSMSMALFYGLYGLYFYSGHSSLELHSIGPVNHSTLYLLLIFTIALSYYFSLEASKIHVILLLFIIFSSLAGICFSDHQAIILSTLSVVLLLFIVNKQYLYYRKLAIFICLIFMLLSMSEYTLLTFEFSLPDNIWDSMRIWGEYNIFFGIGIDNLQNIHANTYITYLLERGLYGIGLYFVFICALFAALLTQYQHSKSPLITAALLIWFINFIMSGFYTTFHDENGLLMALIWGLALNKYTLKSTET
ncbi:MAG: hypothetical protein KAH77_06045 [Thiomargarita sp.]|nr:hypothetical protein [Thiomargarita sp.]